MGDHSVRDHHFKEVNRKYDEERKKRLRADGVKQYVRMKGEFSRYKEDPFAEPTERDPVEREVEVAILGGGFGGLLVAAQLSKRGVTDVCIIEKAGDFGGTWYWNRYPGIGCDTESYIYLPLLEEVQTIPETSIAKGRESLAHAQAIGRHFDLYDKALFQTEVTGAEWDEKSARWTLRTKQGDTIRSRFFVAATGRTFEGKLPGIPGMEKFKGASFHTNRWDFDYTGGDSEGHLDKLQDKRVGIIGTGASAVQCVPHLGKWSKQLYVFQRTPAAVDYRYERPTDADWLRSQKPGWQRERMANFTIVVLGGVLLDGKPITEDLVDDGWTQTSFGVVNRLTSEMSKEEMGQAFIEADFELMERIRAWIDEVVEDKATAKALKPWYRRMCKRPCFHNDYYPTFNRPNVTLVDTDGKGVDEITEKGVVVAGKEYELDCLIYATGFAIPAVRDEPLFIPIKGRNGMTVAEKWSDGPTTMHGLHIHGFPNMYNFSNIQAALSPNVPHTMYEMATHVAYVISEVKRRGAESAEVSAEAEAAWVAHHIAFGEYQSLLWQNCTPSYWNNEGAGTDRQSGGYGGGVMPYIAILENWRDKGDMEGMDLHMADSETAAA